MIKFFNQRGRGLLSMILMGVSLLILIAILLLMSSMEGRMTQLQSAGFTLLWITIAVVMLVGAYLSFSHIKIEDVARLVREEVEAENRAIADVGSFRVRTVPFRELTTWQKIAYVGLPILAVVFVTVGLLDMLGIWPTHVMEMRNVRGDVVKMDRRFTGLIAIMAAVMCILPMLTLRDRFEDDWTTSLRKLFKELGIDKK